MKKIKTSHSRGFSLVEVTIAMAIAAVLPKNEHSERNLIFTVLSVTILSTIAMIAYPIITAWLELDDLALVLERSVGWIGFFEPFGR